MRKILFTLLLVLVFATLSIAAIPEQISIQGKLLDKDGKAITAATDVAFALYDDKTAGASVYSETLKVTPNTSGIFNAVLGAGTAFPAGTDFTKQYWLEISIDEKAVGSRQPLNTAPYAVTAKNVEGGRVTGTTITGTTITGTTVTGGTVTGGTITGDTVSGATVVGGTVYGTSIAAGDATKAFKVDWVDVVGDSGANPNSYTYANTRDPIFVYIQWKDGNYWKWTDCVKDYNVKSNTLRFLAQATSTHRIFMIYK